MKQTSYYGIIGAVGAKYFASTYTMRTCIKAVRQFKRTDRMQEATDLLQALYEVGRINRYDALILLFKEA